MSKPYTKMFTKSLNITYIDYTDNLAVTANNLTNSNFLLQKIDEVSREIALMINTEKIVYMSLNLVIIRIIRI